jgi:hypothetical protein
LNVAAKIDLATVMPLSHNAIMTQPKPTIEFRPTEMRSGRGWYVQVVYFDRPPLQLGGFNTEEEAKEWVAKEAAKWLKEHADDRYA